MAGTIQPSSDDPVVNQEYRGGMLRFAAEVLLPEARAGQRWAALHALACCAQAVLDGEPVSGDVAPWLAQVLAKISEGDSVEEACGIPKRPQGEKKEKSRAKAIRQRFMLAWHFGVLFKHQRLSAREAERKVAAHFKRGNESVKDAWKKHRTDVLRLLALEVAHFGEPSPLKCNVIFLPGGDFGVSK